MLSACEATQLLDAITVPPLPTAEVGDAVIADGLREALTVGSGRVVSALGSEGGFYRSLFHIPLPEKLREAQQIASRFGLEKPFDDLEREMNRAAEAATPRARALFVSAVRQMTFADVMAIYQGPQDAATQYLKRTTGAQLSREMRPMIQNTVDQVGAARTYTDLVRRYNALPLVEPVQADLTGHVLTYTSDAIFSQLAAEEAAIRRDPAKRTTELLRTVFGR